MNFLVHQQSSFPQSEKKLGRNMCYTEFYGHNQNVKKNKDTGVLTVDQRKNKKNLVLITNPKYNANPEHKTFPKYAENCLKQFKPVYQDALNLLDNQTDKTNPKDEDWIRSWNKFVA